ncbi:hypothetical protein RQN30_10505 [Arcanobacterium hippocoleae]
MVSRLNKNNPYTHIGAARQAYIDVRPQYPESLIDSLEINSDSTVLDVGAGTGKLTAQLYSRTKKYGHLNQLQNLRKPFFKFYHIFHVKNLLPQLRKKPHFRVEYLIA